MILKKDMILEVGDDYVLGNEHRNQNILEKIKIIRNNKKIFNSSVINSVNVDLKNRNLYVIVEGEEIYIKYLTVPKEKGETLNNLIKNELIYYFKNVDDILFTYTIVKELETSLEIVVFFLKSDKINLLEKCISSGSIIKSVYLIQFCFLNYFKEHIKSKNYTFIFEYNKSLYFLGCKDNKIVLNEIIKNFDTYDNLEGLINNFLFKLLNFVMNDKIEMIYFANVTTNKITDEFKLNNIYEDLGDINKDEFLSYFTLNRR